MRAKKLGRHELLNWINVQTQSDYPKIENLSDGVAFCQILDAFYPNTVNLNSLKMNSKNMEDWEKNLYLLNEILTKIKSFKQIDPSKMSKGKFTPNLEFLQFIYDYIAKNFGQPVNKFSAYEKRIEILKIQNGSKITDIKKYLPTHLIPNELILRMDKQKFFGQENFQSQENKPNMYRIDQNINEKFNELAEVSSFNLKTHPMVEKYSDFMSILKDDLRKIIDKNVSLNSEINDIEEERQYYLDKINNVMVYCEKQIGKTKPENVSMLSEIIKIIKQVPEDFK